MGLNLTLLVTLLAPAFFSAVQAMNAPVLEAEETHQYGRNVRKFCGPGSVSKYEPIHDFQGTQNGENFGVSVSLNRDGTVLAIGAERFGQPQQTGRVQVYEKTTEGDWEQRGDDILGRADEWFGTSIGLSDSGDELVVGSWKQPGTVRAYHWDGNEWKQVGSTIRGANNWWETLGAAVDISGDGSTIVAGDPTHGPRMTGEARVFRVGCGEEEWIQIGDALDGRTAEDQFGIAVALNRDGSVVAGGGPFNERNGFNAGHARIFEMKHDWHSKGNLINGDNAGDNFGYAVSLNSKGDMIAVGARERLDPGGDRIGYVQVLRFDGDDWMPVGDKVYGYEPNDEFGHAVSFSSDGEKLVASTPYHNGEYARVFKITDAGLEQIGEDLVGDDVYGSPFGRSVAIAGDGYTVAVGATAVKGTISNSFPPGYVRVFEAVRDRC